MRAIGTILVAVFVVGAALLTPAAQTGSSAVPAKNPLLKLIEPWPAAEVLLTRRDEAERRPLFRQTEPLAFTLTANFGAINKDRDPESTRRFPAMLSVADDAGQIRSLHVKLGSRGHFRLMARNCSFVPLRVELQRDEIAGTVFEGQTNLKLGTHCKNDPSYEQFTLREYLVYQLLNTLTPRSFRARLARATYIESKNNKTIGTRYAIFIEHENDVARRLGGRIVELPRLKFADLDAPTLNTMMLFEYMIGNTDFSLWALHNVRVVQDPNRTLFPVPYDFDLSGFVHAPYAIGDPRLGLRSVMDRLYRGPCRSVDELEPIAASFRAQHGRMLDLLDANSALTPAARTEAKAFLEDFFRTVEGSSLKRTFVDGCRAQDTM